MPRRTKSKPRPKRSTALASANSSVRCEGYRRFGGAFSLGPVTWQQCSERAIAVLTIEQDGKVQDVPACSKCWTEAMYYGGIKITATRPVAPNNEVSEPARKT